MSEIATFELIFMTARSCHIRGSRFRRLPNPCGDAPSCTIRAAVCLQELAAIITRSDDLGSDPLTQEIKNAFVYGRFDSLSSLDREGRPLNELIENHLSAETGVQKKAVNGYAASLQNAEETYVADHVALMDALHTASDKMDHRLAREAMHEHLRSVITAHFSTVLGQRPGLQAHLARSTSVEKDLVEFYFENVRPAVVRPGATRVTLGKMSAPEAQRSAVWLALMFRMWSWMVLHEFNPADKMIERTEFMNSRLPVYIG